MMSHIMLNVLKKPVGKITLARQDHSGRDKNSHATKTLY